MSGFQTTVLLRSLLFRPRIRPHNSQYFPRTCSTDDLEIFSHPLQHIRAAKMEGEAGPSLQSTVANRDTCAVCQGIGEEDHPRGKLIEIAGYSHEYLYIHYPNLVVLDQSARNGCQVCSFLVRALKTNAKFASIWDKASELERTRVGSFDIDHDTAEAARLPKRYGQGNTPDYASLSPRVLLSFSYFTRGTTRNLSRWSHRFYRITVGHELANQIMVEGPLQNVRADPIDHDPPTQDLLSDAHTRLVHRWMKSCDEKHEKCRRALGQSQKLPKRWLKVLKCRLGLGQRSKLPKRLLEISSNPATGEITKIRLIETTPSSKGIYACLSYCWGRSAQDYKTTRSNLLRYLESIPFNSLPGTIIDTLKLCCKLGFRYVWVDSLCIIQGDNEDWKREASNMAGIYGGSNLTLAIHLCEDSSESFLQKRQQPQHRVLGGNIARIAYTDELSQEKRLIYLWKETEDQSKWKVGGHVNLMWGRSPWLDRAWTFQEWLLSPRVLHIQQITQWECLQGNCNEIQHRFPARFPLDRYPNLLDKNWTWMSIIEEFTRRKIGKDEDRLPALAGLAKKYRDKTGYEYLAGIWRQELPDALLWHKEGPDYLKSPAGFRAPSWSWASLEGAINVSVWDFPVIDSVSTASVISAECTYCPPDTLSTVISAWLDIEGPMSLVTKRKIDENGTIRFVNDGVPTWAGLDWLVHLDQDTCSRKDLAQSKIYLFKVKEEEALVLEKTGQSGGKDTFKRRGYAYRYCCNRQCGHWRKKLIRLV